MLVSNLHIFFGEYLTFFIHFFELYCFTFSIKLQELLIDSRLVLPIMSDNVPWAHCNDPSGDDRHIRHK